MRNIREYDEDDFLMLSGIHHFVFCRRRWALVHIEDQWEDNIHTVIGNLVHENAHDKLKTERRGGVIITKGMPVHSRTLGISGECDVVEFHSDIKGADIPMLGGRFRVVPVEYKKGSPKDTDEDILQLAAQAYCLEEMLGTDIPIGFMYYAETKRRQQVEITAELKDKLKDVCGEMHEYYKRGYTPKVKTSKKCNACSLKDICLPKLNNITSAKKYIRDRLSEDTL